MFSSQKTFEDLDLFEIWNSSCMWSQIGFRDSTNIYYIFQWKKEQAMTLAWSKNRPALPSIDIPYCLREILLKFCSPVYRYNINLLSSFHNLLRILHKIEYDITPILHLWVDSSAINLPDFDNLLQIKPNPKRKKIK